MREPTLRCALCHDQLVGARYTCDGCGTALHTDCQAALSECPTLGCAHRVTRSAPTTKPRFSSRFLQAAVLVLVAGVAWSAGAWSQHDDFSDYDWNEEAFETLDRRSRASQGANPPSRAATPRHELSAREEGVDRGNSPAHPHVPLVGLGGEAYAEVLYVSAVERLHQSDLALDSAAELLLVLALAPTGELALCARAYLDWLVTAWQVRLLQDAANFGQRDAVLALSAALPPPAQHPGPGADPDPTAGIWDVLEAREKRPSDPRPLVAFSSYTPRETFQVDVRAPALQSRATLLSFLFAEAGRQRATQTR